RPRNSCRQKRSDCCDLIPRKLLRAVKLVVALQIDPELRRGPEVLRETQCGVRGNPPLSVHDLVDPPQRNPDRDGEPVLRDPEAPDEILHEALPWVSPPPPVQRRSTRSRCATGR